MEKISKINNCTGDVYQTLKSSLLRMLGTEENIPKKTSLFPIVKYLCRPTVSSQFLD